MRQKHLKKIRCILISLIFLSSCSFGRLNIKPIFSRNKTKVQADSRYYEGKAQSLVRQIYYDSRKSDVSKVAVMDLMDIAGKSPMLGKFLGNKISAVIIQSNFFTIVQKGELKYIIDELNIYESQNIDSATLMKLGKMLSIDAVLTGSIVDLGTSYDVTLMSIDVRTGDVIASASEEIARTKYAVDLMTAF